MNTVSLEKTQPGILPILPRLQNHFLIPNEKLAQIYVTSYFVSHYLSFVVSTMSQKNKIALLFIGAGLISGIIISYHLPIEKLPLALTGPTAVVGAGLSEWNSRDEKSD